MHIQSLKNRRDNIEKSDFEVCLRDTFIEFLKKINISENSTALSVSVGNGFWDYLVFKYLSRVKKIIATDVVDNPVDKEGIALLNELGEWEFKKVEAEKNLPFADNSFDMVFHQDVVEHVKKPYLFLSEQHRVLKEGGTLILGTPNIFRPSNVVKLLIGKLFFPLNIGGFNEEIGEAFHMQEFNEFQLKNLLEEVGFKDIEIKHCYFGIWFLRITFKLYPKGRLGKGLCHYLMVKCRK